MLNSSSQREHVYYIHMIRNLFLAKSTALPPGPRAMWIGLQRLREFVIALEAQEALSVRCV